MATSPESGLFDVHYRHSGRRDWGWTQGVDDRDWGRLVEQLAGGDCTPFLGSGACDDLLPAGGELSQIWANHYEYPFSDSTDLATVMQYAIGIERDPVTVKKRVIDQLRRLTEASGGVPLAHALLARYPLPVFLTTNYDPLMAQALRREDKQPLAAVCPWHEVGRKPPGVPPAFEPTAAEPLIYHLHGSMEDAASLVLSEQDYLEFLTRLVMERGMNDHRLLPPQVLDALTRRPLLFVGYSLRDWSFKVLFHGLIQRLPKVRRRRHVSVQLLPDNVVDHPQARQRAEDYLRSYYSELDISIYLGTVQEFCAELDRRMEAA